MTTALSQSSVEIADLEKIFEDMSYTSISKKNLRISVPTKHRKLLPLKISLSQEYPLCEINPIEYQFITSYKNKINAPTYSGVWDQYKKYSNRYELVHMPSNKKKNHDSIAFYIPMSRSFFKLWEMIFDFNLLPKDQQVTTGHIAEGPGGFMEAWVRARERQLGYCHDKLHGITLLSSKREIPGWEKMNYFIKSYSEQINIGYGSDGTGDIYQIHNIRHFVRQVGPNSCHLVTADGGFDFSVDFVHQEQLAYKLIFSEILIAIQIQKIGGAFVCKLFDSFTHFTVKLIWLLNCCYREVIITKPVTSRPANSEKYLLCRDFQGIDHRYVEDLMQILFSWNQIECGDYKVVDIFQQQVPPLYLNIISDYNHINIKKQLSSIMETLYWIEKKLTKKEMGDITGKQVEIAIQWCLKYQTTVNYRSHYLNPDDGFKIRQHQLTLKQKNQKAPNDFFY